MSWFHRNPEFRRQITAKAEDSLLRSIRSLAVKRGWSSLLADYNPILGRVDDSDQRKAREDAVTCHDGISGREYRVRDLPK